MNKFIIPLKMITFTASAALIFSGLNYVLRPANTDQSFIQIEAYHSMPENSVDVLFLGSSHMWHGIDTKYLFDEYGLRGYNYASNWQHIATTELFLEDALSTQKPKLIVIDTQRINDVFADVYLDGEIYYTKALNAPIGKERYLSTVLTQNNNAADAYHFPFLSFHNNWEDIDKNNFIYGNDIPDFKATLGYDPVSDRLDEDDSFILEDAEINEEMEINHEQLEIMDRIIQLASDNGAKLLFITLPYGNIYNFGNATKAYADSKGIEYLNLFDHLEELALDEEDDFSDPSHLNTSGALKITKYVYTHCLGDYTNE